LYFCLRAIGRRPHRLFDTQIAAGLTGLEYPAAYRTLILKLLGKNVAKGETRTDWRRRPLSHRQIEYALQDVVHLQPIRDALVDKLASLGRLPWLEAEIEDWQARVEAAELNESWRRLPGLAALPPRSLAVARELWRWRDELAERQNRHPRRILRDDLLVELARQATDDVHRIRAVRGLHRRDMEQYLQPLAGAIRRGLARPEAEWPQVANRTASRPQFTILGQFLATALTCVCREHSVAPSLVATVDDVRDWVAYRLGLSGFAGGQPPALAQGWRAELLGARFDELFAGNLTLRVTDPRLEQPLVFQARQADAGIAGVRNDGG
jgi:ribonuclease D